MAVIVVVDPLLTRPGALDDDTFPGHRLVPVDPRAPADGAAEALAEASVLLTAMAPVDRALLARAPRLGLVAKPGAGVDNIDLDGAAERGVLVCHAPGTRGQAVAEHVVWALLELAKRSATGGGTAAPLDLAGTTLGLVGLGDIGARVARVGSALGMDVVAATRSRRPVEGVEVRFTAIEEIHREVDALVLCAPLAPGTTGLVAARTLAGMRPGAVVVNVARGRCVVTDDLTEALSAGRLRGAALDVADPEPLPPDHPLRRMPNVIVTDHVAGRTPRAQRLALDRMVADVRAFLDGLRPEHVVVHGGADRPA